MFYSGDEIENMRTEQNPYFLKKKKQFEDDVCANEQHIITLPGWNCFVHLLCIFHCSIAVGYVFAI